MCCDALRGKKLIVADYLSLRALRRGFKYDIIPRIGKNVSVGDSFALCNMIV